MQINNLQADLHRAVNMRVLVRMRPCFYSLTCMPIEKSAGGLIMPAFSPAGTRGSSGEIISLRSLNDSCE